MNKILTKAALFLAIVIALPLFAVNAEESALSFSCGPSKSKVMIGETVTWNANISGGVAPYTSYAWSSSALGETSISGDSLSTTMTYDAAGSYGAQFSFMDGEFSGQGGECARVQVVAPVEFVSCTPSPTTGNVGYNTTWHVEVKGGVAPYTLAISGSDGLTGDGLSTKITYTTAGIKTATVTNISSSFEDAGTLAGPFECKSATIYAEPTELTAACSADKTSIKEGESVTWSANVSGGTAPYSYNWAGTDSLSGTGATASKTYSAQGTKTATLDVMDSAGTAIAGISCSSVTVSEKTTTTSGSGGGSSSGSGSSRSTRTTSSTSTTSTTSTTTGTTRPVVTADVPVNTVTFANNTNTVARPVVAVTASATTSVAKATSTDTGIDEANLLASAGALGFIKDNKIISTIVALLILGLAWFIVFFKRRKKEEETPTTN